MQSFFILQVEGQSCVNVPTQKCESVPVQVIDHNGHVIFLSKPSGGHFLGKFWRKLYVGIKSSTNQAVLQETKTGRIFIFHYHREVTISLHSYSSWFHPFFRSAKLWSAQSQRWICATMTKCLPNLFMYASYLKYHSAAQVVTAKIPKQVCGHSSEFTKRKTNPSNTKRYAYQYFEKFELS